MDTVKKFERKILNLKIYLPDEVNFIIKQLEKHNYSAFIVGGCVRDSILGRVPADFDIATSCMPNDIIKIFKNHPVIATGLNHGTVTVIVNKLPYEITTYRYDGKYSDNRRPDNVVFTSSISEDLSRRDFTINAMAYNPIIGLIDTFNGFADLEAQIIRCVGEPEQRFKEDALRMLRACRFYAQLDFKLEENTKKAIYNSHELLKNISKERIRDELNKILLSFKPDVLNMLIELGLNKYIIPELEKCRDVSQYTQHGTCDIFHNVSRGVLVIEKNIILKLTMLLHDIGKAYTKTIDENGICNFYAHSEISAKIAGLILNRLKYSTFTKSAVVELILNHENKIKPCKKSIRGWLNKLGEDKLQLLLKVKEANVVSQNSGNIVEQLKNIDETRILLSEILNNNECYRKKDLKINGNDLIQQGLFQNKDIGKILNELVEIVLDDPRLNTRDFLLNYIKKKYI